MHWLLQKNALSKEMDTFDTIVRTLNAGGISWTPVRALSFTDKIVAADTVLQGKELKDIPDLDLNVTGPVMVYGSYTLALIAKKKNWVPGAFINEHFTHDALVQGWGAHALLNGDACVYRLDELDHALKHRDLVFLRPFEDTKSFSGMLQHATDVRWWAAQALLANGPLLQASTKIVVGSPRTIFAEYRLFVVDNIIVTSSLYKLGQRVMSDTYTPDSVLKYAQECIERWVPDRAFVLDIAETPEGLCVIEVNNINSSGVYAANVSRLIQELDAMVF